MNTALIQQSWNSLSGHHHDLIDAFYERLFERYPSFEQFFDMDRMGQQMDKMMNTLALVACYSEDGGLIGPRLRRIGAAHAHYGIGEADLQRFSEVLVEVIGEFCRRYNPEGWTAECERAWLSAFQDVVLPEMAGAMD